MARWADFAAARPEMAALLIGIMDWIPIVYLATTAADGAPRVHPVVPVVAAEGIFVIAIPSPKTRDLLRDGRYALHALPGKWREVDGQTRGDDEFYMTGRVRVIDDEATKDLVRKTAKHGARPQDVILELLVERVMTAYWEKVGQPGTYPVRQFWRAQATEGRR